jgi:hypothetical protein
MHLLRVAEPDMSRKRELARLLIRGRIGRGIIFSGLAMLALGGAILAGALTSPAWHIITGLMGGASITAIAMIAIIAIVVGNRSGPPKRMDVDSFQATHVRPYSIYLPINVLFYGGYSGVHVWALVRHSESDWQTWLFGLLARISQTPGAGTEE